MNETDVLLTVRQLQDLLQVDRITIYRMLGDGRLRGFKVGGQWRFSRQAIESWLHEQQARLEPLVLPGGGDGLHCSQEAAALPLSCIRAIQEILAQALGVAVVTVAAGGAALTPVANCCRFCELILDSPAGRQRCAASWRDISARPGATPRLATCHAGLRYLWHPIEVQGRFVAAAHAGQFLDQSPVDHAWADAIRHLAAACSLDSQELSRALGHVPVLDRDRRQLLSRLLERTATTFAEIGEERLNLLGRLRRIAEITEV